MKTKIPYIPKPIVLEACKILIKNHVELIKKEADSLIIMKGAGVFSKAQIKILETLKDRLLAITEMATTYNTLQEKEKENTAIDNLETTVNQKVMKAKS